MLYSHQKGILIFQFASLDCYLSLGKKKLKPNLSQLNIECTAQLHAYHFNYLIRFHISYNYVIKEGGNAKNRKNKQSN